MMELDALGVNRSRTFVVPNPGGKGQPKEQIDISSEWAFVGGGYDEVPSGNSTLLQIANPLLNLIYQIRVMVHNSDPSRLRGHLIEEIKKFDSRAKNQGVLPEIASTARYCLCTALDETAAQTPWGSGGVWARYSLLVTFYQETWGGEKFFQILGQVCQSPAVYRDLIELMYFCISLGFEGRYKILPNGQHQLGLLRHRLCEIISEMDGGKYKNLSPHWQGVTKPRSPIWTLMPVWVSTFFFTVTIVIVFTVFSLKLSDSTSAVFSNILALPIPPAPDQKAPKLLKGKVSEFLSDYIAAGLIKVQEFDGVAIVTLKGDGLFSSGSVTTNPIYDPIIHKVGLAIISFGKGATISGHSDNIPIRNARFPSNWHLSLERAKVVAAQLSGIIGTQKPLAAKGLGEAEPIASNQTSEGRAINRRVEIKIILSNGL